MVMKKKKLTFFRRVTEKILVLLKTYSIEM